MVNISSSSQSKAADVFYLNQSEDDYFVLATDMITVISLSQSDCENDFLPLQ